MAYSPMYTGQTDPPAQWTLFDDANNPVNLTPYTLLPILIVDQKNPSNVRVGGTPTIVGQATNGVIQYQWLASDSSVAGYFNIYVRAQTAGGNVRFFEAPGPWQVVQA